MSTPIATEMTPWIEAHKNNKPASDAIPLFEQAFVPALSPLEPLTRNQGLADAKTTAQGLRSATFGLARDVAAAVVPTLPPESE